VPTGNGTFLAGVWSLVDALPPGSTATLVLNTTVNQNAAAALTVTNTVEIIAADQADFDSTPANDNGDQSEDDEDRATVNVVVPRLSKRDLLASSGRTSE
jgi:hypothetical protein